MKYYGGQNVTGLKVQGCGSGSGLDPDSETLWIRIRIGNPNPGARNFSGKMHFYLLKKNFTTKKV
jgi:hypothetical protein